jgi:hypothetical protein
VVVSGSGGIHLLLERDDQQPHHREVTAAPLGLLLPFPPLLAPSTLTAWLAHFADVTHAGLRLCCLAFIA